MSKYIFVAINTLLSIITILILSGFKQLYGANINSLWSITLVMGVIGLLTMTIIIPLQILLDAQKQDLSYLF